MPSITKFARGNTRIPTPGGGISEQGEDLPTSGSFLHGEAANPEIYVDPAVAKKVLSKYSYEIVQFCLRFRSRGFAGSA